MPNKNRKYDPEETDRTQDENDQFEILNNTKYSTPSQSIRAFNDLGKKRAANRKKEMFNDDQIEKGIEAHMLYVGPTKDKPSKIVMDIPKVWPLKKRIYPSK